MQHRFGEKLFFLDNDHEVNKLVFRIGGIFMAVLAGILAAAYFNVFKVSPAEVLSVMALLLGTETVLGLLIKLGAPVAVVKYYGLLSMELCLMAMSANAYFGVYISYILIPVISCLYFDKKLTRNIIVLCYFGMLAALWLRAPGAISLAYPGYTRVGWFISFGLGYTLEYVAISAVIYAVSKRARRYMEELHHRRERIGEIQNKIILRFADLVESRDDTTGKHVKRTSRYAVMIAQKLREKGEHPLGQDDITNIELAAPLHDIGKIVVSDVILQKPGKLTPEEFERIKEHTTQGVKIIDSSMEGIEGEDFISVAREMALSHHERWDGGGYPTGAAGADISLPARIMAVADVFDALVSDRCYKRAIPVERAFEIIREESGSHFDPAVAQAFLECESEIREIMAEE